jgi:hypothetical protein
MFFDFFRDCCNVNYLGRMDENDTNDTRTIYRSKNCTEFSICPLAFTRLGGGGDFPSRPPVCFFVVSREGAGCVLGCAACLFARRIYLHEGMQGWTTRSANRPQGGGG